MSEFPLQTRTVDPYSSYNSNVVNQLTRMISRGKNCLHGTHAIDVVIDSTSSDTCITILPGEAFKDDVIIQINENTSVDFSDSDYYLNHLSPLNEAGYYYICIEYVYAKARPAPQAKIRLLKPSQTYMYDEQNGAFILLKVADVIFNGVTFEINELYDFDPSVPDNKRVFSQIYAGSEDTIPNYDKNRDEGRLIYVKDRDEMFFGIENRWESFNAVRANIDTSACQSGDVGYLDVSGEVKPAIATSNDTLGSCVVITSGVDLEGKVRLYGEVNRVRIETGININFGEKVFLSDVEAGTISNEKSHSFIQQLGISTSIGTVSGYCDIWFLPQQFTESGGTSNIIDFYQDLLHSSIFEYLFIESFDNRDYIDLVNSTITSDNYDNSLHGYHGDIYQSTSVQVADFNTRMNVVQVSAKYWTQTSAEIRWYISNNGSEPLDWEVLELDKLHDFSSYRIEFSSTTGIFEVGENVLSSVTNKMATINGINSGQILIFGDTRAGLNYNIGETITGQTSGATGVISNIVDREQPSYHDLRIKTEFYNVGANDGIHLYDGKIYDFGILYDLDEDIFEEPSADLQANLDTLYIDLYTWPSQDNDGMANLTTPLETQITDLRNYTQNVVYNELNDLIYFVDSTCCVRVDQLEDDVLYLTNKSSMLEDFIDNTCCVQLTQVQNEFVDLKYFVDTTCCYELEQVSDSVYLLNQSIIYIQDQIYDILDTTGAFHIAQVNSADIDSLYADIYSSQTRDGDSNPNLTIPLETQIANLHGPNSPLIINSVDATPDVSNFPSIIRFDYSSNLTVIDFHNGVIGQELVLVFTNDKIIIQNNLNISTANGSDFYSQDEYTLTLVHNGFKWIERSGIVSTMIIDGGTA